MKSVAIIDLSWLMYMMRRSYRESGRIVVIDGVQHRFPTGHLEGTVGVVTELTFQYDMVILAVDSNDSYRWKVLPSYKAGRHAIKGDEFEDYKIMTDLKDLLGLLTWNPKVWYIKKAGFESDDIIASFIRLSSGGGWGKELHAYFNDNDILQTKGVYHWHRHVNAPVSSREEYIQEKYGLEGFDYLPIWWKVIAGDSSDNIPSCIPGLRKDVLRKCCVALGGSQNFNDLLGFLQGYKFTKAFQWVLGEDSLVHDPLLGKLYVNWSMVSPLYGDLKDFELKKLGYSAEVCNELLFKYQLKDFRYF
jgi:hypothetical protein